MNNARYVQWIQDMLEPGVLGRAQAMRLDINYLREVKLGETLELWKAPIPGHSPEQSPEQGLVRRGLSLAVEGRRGGEAVFRAELRLDPMG
jgi:acyl-ACP thioesterase